MNTVTRTRQIDEDVLNVLGSAETQTNSLRITAQLDRKLYVKTNEVLEALGGKWNRKAGAHLFDADAAELVEQALLTGTFSKSKQDFGAFYTPAALVTRLVDLADVQPGMHVLEPEAGTGRIALALYAKNPDCLTAYEIQPIDKLKAAFAPLQYRPGMALELRQADFLTVLPAPCYDRVVMNPPFAKRADIIHITHAASFVKPGGRLVSIASASVRFRDDRLSNDFRALVKAHDGTIEDLPAESFKESGTGVNTVIVTMNF